MYYSVFAEVDVQLLCTSRDNAVCGSLAPTHERGTDVDGETRQRGRLGVVRENQSLEAEPLLHARQEAHAGDADVIALFRLLRVGSLIGLTAIFRLISDVSTEMNIF